MQQAFSQIAAQCALILDWANRTSRGIWIWENELHEVHANVAITEAHVVVIALVTEEYDEWTMQ